MAWKQMTTLEKIIRAVEEAKPFPTANIHYKYEELPDHPEITPTSFFGVPATFNKQVGSEYGYSVTYKFS